MRRFIYKTSFFILKTLVVFLLLFLAIIFYFKSHPFKESHSTVFLGDSRIQYLYNNKDNLAQGSEPLKYSYLKLITLAKMNKLDTVFIGFSHHSLSTYWDPYMNYYEMTERLALPRYFVLLDWQETLRGYKFSNLKYLLHNQFEQSYKCLFEGANFIPGQFDTTRKALFNGTKQMQLRIQEQFYSEGKIAPFSELNLMYFDKIKQYCKVRNIQLVLVNTPVHSKYYPLIPEIYKSKYDSITKGFQILDISNLLKEDRCFLADGDHVSMDGSRLMTKVIDQYRSTNKIIY
jgi:hypothetical protein